MRLIRTCERVTGTVFPSHSGGYGFSVRIVSLLPSTTEILLAIGAGGDVVGVTFECDYPPEARSRRIVSTSACPPGSAQLRSTRRCRRQWRGVRICATWTETRW